MKYKLLILLIFSISFCYQTTKAFAGIYNEDMVAEEFSSFPISFQVKMNSWHDVNKIIPKYSKFQVIDYETGASFSVQRRAGSKHADVQPLTTKDTAIFKKIFNGKWSWNRRAALVLVNDQLIAASMHGMPHGAGALKNGFPGHFCIHFFQSTTHGSKTPDLGHQLMVLRSAGKLDSYLDQIPAHDIINVFFTALNNNDIKLVESVVWLENQQTAKDLQQLTTKIEGVRWRMYTIEEFGQNFHSGHIPIEFEIYIKNQGITKTTVDLQLIRSSLFGRWMIDPTPLLTKFK